MWWVDWWIGESQYLDTGLFYGVYMSTQIHTHQLTLSSIRSCANLHTWSLCSYDDLSSICIYILVKFTVQLYNLFWVQNYRPRPKCSNSRALIATNCILLPGGSLHSSPMAKIKKIGKCTYTDSIRTWYVIDSEIISL